MEEGDPGQMTISRTGFSVAAVLLICAGSVHAMDIGGPISTTLTITEDSQFVDDVTCTVTLAPCINLGSPK